MNGQVNTQNVREYAAAGQPPEFNFDVNISRDKLTVWMGLCGNGQTIGPFFFNRNIDGLNYLQMINNDVIPQLQQHFQRQVGGAFRNLWWVQDGAPAHRMVAVRERLREFFGQRVIALYHNVDLGGVPQKNVRTTFLVNKIDMWRFPNYNKIAKTFEYKIVHKIFII